MSTLTLPTELSEQLKSNRVAQKIYRALSDTAKQSYVTYVIAANSVSERRDRAEHSIRMLLGQSNQWRHNTSS